MIQRSHNLIELECDSCGQAESDENISWEFFWHTFKTLGWRAKRVGADWIHSCPACAKKSEEPMTLDAVNQALFGGKK